MNDNEAIEILRRIDIKFFLCGMIEQNNYIVDEADKVNNAIETVLNLLENQKAEIEEKDKMINEYEKECRQFKAFCKRVRRDEKHDVDLFNQGQEHKCNQFLNLISGEPHWSYEGKYFDDDGRIWYCPENNIIDVKE